MSLATRCAACGTVFRVVQDQLKVSEGWVRCGRCGDVFNALEGLFDLEREAAPAWTPSQRGPLDLLPASAADHAAQKPLPAANEAWAPIDDDAPAEAIDNFDAGAAEDTLIDTRTDSRIESHAPESLDDEAVGRGEGSDFLASSADDDVALLAADAEPAPTPAFLRQAERAARWRRPGVRVALALAATVLGLLLATQAALRQRDAIATRWPQAAPWLAHLCEPVGCRLEPLRHLDGLAVESSGLTQLDVASQYRLQVVLRNRDAQALLAPALDVTLTDNRGDVVARKVFLPRDFGVATTGTLAAGAELPLQAVLDSGERRISGYSIEIFYP
jgi:predicted Zn finger-like uncharacterized protein